MHFGSNKEEKPVMHEEVLNKGSSQVQNGKRHSGSVRSAVCALGEEGGAWHVLSVVVLSLPPLISRRETDK